jgi:peptidoglycan-associated lipoprotein
MKNLLKVVLVFALAAGLTACQKNVKDDANADLTAGTGAVSGAEMVIAEDGTVVETDTTYATQEIALGAVYFGLDKANLTADARKIVEANVQAIKSAAAMARYTVTIEGNCDDRGTTAYNIALGQKRADELKANYVRLGIPAANIVTVSYGEEKPVCTESTQACWAQNRRADTLLSVK